MSSFAKTLPLACSFLAVVGSGVAIIMVQEAERPVRTEMSPTSATSIVELEQRLSLLRRDLTAVQLKLGELEAASVARSANTDEEASDPESTELSSPAGQTDERILAAVDAVLEERGVEFVERAQRDAKRRGMSAGYSKFIHRIGDRLPRLRESVADRMELDLRRRSEVEEILENSHATMTALLDQLDADPPLSEEEADRTTAEIWGTVSTMVGELDEILEPTEMVELGTIVQDEEMPKVGHAIIAAGRQGLDQQAAQERDQD